MKQINDFEFSIAMKIAANKCLAEDVEEFLALDTENTVVDPHVEKRIKRKLVFEESKNFRRVSAKVLKYAVIVLMSAVSLFFGASMTIRPVRAAFVGAIVTWYEDHIDVRYEVDVASEENENIESGFEVHKPSSFPEGWSVTYEHSIYGLYSCDITDSDNGCARFTQYKDFENGLGVDNDVYEEQVVYLKNDTVEANLFISPENEYVLVWKDEYMFKLEAENIEFEELLMIAESVK